MPVAGGRHVADYSCERRISVNFAMQNGSQPFFVCKFFKYIQSLRTILIISINCKVTPYLNY